MSPSGSPPAPPWRPTASLDNLRLRADLLARLRAFFAARGVLEVETPLLSAAAVTDLHLDSVPARLAGRRRWLATSPEYPMKRLLAAGAGPIYQICKAFRDGETGRRHNPEFTLVEWYRPGWDHHRLEDEVDELLAEILGTPKAQRWSYRRAFIEGLGLDPWKAEVPELIRRAEALGVATPPDLDRDEALQLLLAECVEPRLGRDLTDDRPAFLHGFPPAQAALARLGRDEDGHEVAERFEVFVDGVELANGFHELTDAAEQRRRFEEDLAKRRAAGKAQPPVDEAFLAALEAGLPPSAGVALGFDRLVMLAAGAESLEEVLAFPADRA